MNIGKIILIIKFTLYTSFIWAQTDSITVTRTKWVKKKIASGIKLNQFWFNHSLFGASQNISILEVKMHGKSRIDVVADSKILKPTSSFGNDVHAVAGINGTFFNMKKGGSSFYLRVNGHSVDSSWAPGKERELREQCAVVCNGNDLRIVAWDGSVNWEKQLIGEDVMVAGPLLLQHGLRVHTASFNTERNPRTAVAIKGNTLLLITVDGRNNKAAGMSFSELASFIKWLGADDAINLDGGGSTTMWVAGFPDGGIINHPSDNKKMMASAQYKPGMDLDKLAADTKKWNHSDERPVSNVLMISRKKSVK